jgi:hypothetical protein
MEVTGPALCHLLSTASVISLPGDFHYPSDNVSLLNNIEADIHKFTQWCNQYRAQMTPAPVAIPASISPSSDNLYLSCEEKRRAGYVLDDNEIDYCAKPPADDKRRGKQAKKRLQDEISRRLAAAAEEPPHAVRQQCRNGGVLVPNCYNSIVDGQCWRQTLDNVGWNPTPIAIDQCPAEVVQSYCAEFSQYDRRTCPPAQSIAPVAAAVPTVEQDRNLDAAPSRPFTLGPASETEAEIRRLKQDFESNR